MNASSTKEINTEPWITIKQGLITGVSEDFSAICGYEKEELVGKEILHVLNDILRLNTKVNNIEKLDTIESCYIINKAGDFKTFRITVREDEDKDMTYLCFEQQPIIALNNAMSCTHQLICNSTFAVAMYLVEDFVLLKANDKYINLMSERVNECDIVGKKVQEFSPNWANSIDRAIWEKVIETQQPYYISERPSQNPKTKEMEYYESSVVPIIDNGKVKFIISTLNNITEKVRYRKENEKKAMMIEKQKELLEAVIENQHESIYILDAEGNIIISNKKGKERYYPNQINSVNDLFQASEFYDMNGKRLELHETPAYRVHKGEKIVNETLKTEHNGSSMYVNLNGTPIYKQDGTFDYAFLSGADITELVDSWQLIEQQKNQLQAIMENMSDAIFIVDKSGKYIMQNKAALKYFSKELKDIGDAFKAAEFYEMDGERIPFGKMPEVLMFKGKEIRDEVINIRSQDGEKYVSVSATPIFDQKGNFSMGVLSVRDITEYVKRNETIKEQHIALLMAEKRERENLERAIAMKDEFLSLVSHEFKTPLTVINSALQTLELVYKDQLTEKVSSYIDKIKQNTFRQVRLVNNLLDITRANAGHLKLNMRNLDMVFMTKVIVESVRAYAQHKGVNINFECKLREKKIAMDDEKYERIMLNLLSNAIKFTPPGKSITVELRDNADRLMLIVKDEGIGIPKDKQEMIFERFGQVDSTFTRQNEGSGIGLTLVRQMVYAMGGQIQVESELGKGSSFYIEFPEVLVKEEGNQGNISEQIDARLIQSIAIEFSDIYF